MELLRGPADRQRQAGLPPRPLAGLQGHLPALPRDDRRPGAAQGAAGTATASRSSWRSRRSWGSRPRPRSRSTGSPSSTPSCRESVFRYVEDWKRLTERIGFWIDMDDPYVTMENDYIESVWWALRRMWDDGRLYEGHKVVPYCPRCGTALSSHEVAQGYHDVEDPSVYVKLPVREPGPSDADPRVPAGARRPAAGLDHHPLDADHERRRRGRARDRVRPRPIRGDRSTCWRGTASRRCSGRGPRCWPTSRRGAGGDLLRAPLRLHHRLRAKGPHGPARRLRLHRRGNRPGPHRDRLRRGRLPARRAVRDHAAEPGQARRHLRRPHHRLRRPLRQGGRRRHRQGAGGEGKAAARRDLPAQLSALLALRHAPPLLREVELVRGDDPGQGPAAGRQRGDRLAPRAHQARPLRQVAREQRGLGAQPRPLLGNAAADLGVRGPGLRGDASARARSRT